MFNPFKKKDNSFKLDESILPSLKEEIANNTAQLPQDSSIPEVNSLAQNTSTDPFSLNDIPNNEPTTNNNQMSNFNEISKINENNNPIKNNTSNMDFEFMKNKIETLELKTTLIDSKLSSMDQKLQLILELISNEVSDETKQKFQVDSMMKNIRNN